MDAPQVAARGAHSTCSNVNETEGGSQPAPLLLSVPCTKLQTTFARCTAASKNELDLGELGQLQCRSEAEDEPEARGAESQFLCSI